jgi:hypothetical protein
MDPYEMAVIMMFYKIEGFRHAMMILDYEEDAYPYYSKLAYDKLVEEFYEAEVRRDLRHEVAGEA